MIRSVDSVRLDIHSPHHLTYLLSMFAPFGTPATNVSAHWHPEPRGRGTFNILSSCLTTMLLCVWTAVHLNIPDRDGGKRQKFLRKPGWLLMALLAPGIVAWNAWEQRKVARELTDAFVRTFGSGPKPPPGWIRRAWAAIRFCSLSSKVSNDAQKSRSATHDSPAGRSFGFRTRIATRFTIKDHYGSRFLRSYGWLCGKISPSGQSLYHHWPREVHLKLLERILAAANGSRIVPRS
jgi:hypothetical protein